MCKQFRIWLCWVSYSPALDPGNPQSGVLLVELTISAEKDSEVSIMRHPNKREERSELVDPALSTYTQAHLCWQSRLS